MVPSDFVSNLGRRNILIAAAGASPLMLVAPAQAEPITILIIGGKVVAAKVAAAKAAAAAKIAAGAKAAAVGGAVGLVLTKFAQAETYQPRTTPRQPGYHGDTAPGIEVRPGHRGPVDLQDGGKVMCPDGQIRAVPPGTTVPNPHDDLSGHELILGVICGAPYPIQPRIRPSPGDANERSKRMEDIFRVPMNGIRYVRTMTDRSGNRFLLASALGKDRRTEHLAMWTLMEPKERLVSPLVGAPWMTKGARDMV